jgi:cytoskeletal protein RodZ
MQDYSTPEPAAKKGLSGWAWAGIGCGTVLLICVVVSVLLVGWCTRAVNDFSNDMKANPERKAAEMMIGIHPDFSVVSSNDETKEMTIKEDKTGKEMTFSYKDIADGKFAVKGSDGSEVSLGAVDVSTLPAWLPLPADAKAQSGYQAKNNGKQSGLVVFTTALAPADVQKHFEDSWASWTNSSGESTAMNFNGVDTINLSRKTDDKELGIVIQGNAGVTTVTVTYTEK